MKKALVIGASGGMGYSLVKELSNRGISVVAFARTKSRLEKLFSEDQQVKIFAGDVFNEEQLRLAAQGVEVIFQAANLPYVDWEEKLPTFIMQILKVANEQKAKVAFVDNIYAYGRSRGRKINEEDKKDPHTKKGKIRLQIESMIKKSTVPAIIAHFPDFYGPNAENTILHYTLKNIVANKSAFFVGDKRIAREYIYTPDGAKALVNLSLREDAYHESWNIPGFGVITGNELIHIVKNKTQYNKKVSTITKNMIRLIGIFDKNMREVVEMFYLNEEPVTLNGKKYEERIGKTPATCYEEGIKETITYMIENENK